MKAWLHWRWGERIARRLGPFRWREACQPRWGRKFRWVDRSGDQPGLERL